MRVRIPARMFRVSAVMVAAFAAMASLARSARRGRPIALVRAPCGHGQSGGRR
jgi:hypothetical protein